MLRIERSGLLALALALGCGGAEPPPTRSAVDARPTTPAPSPASDVRAESGTLAPMPVAVTSFGAATLGGHLYVLGGYHGEPHVYDREGQSRTLSRLRLDGEGTWEEVSTLEQGLQGVALAAHEGSLYRVGGNTIENAPGEPAHLVSVPDFARFDPRQRAWTTLPSLPAGRSSHEAAVIGDVLYVAGGWALNGGPDGATWHGDLLAYDLSQGEGGEWRTIDAPFERRALAVAAAGGRLYVIGGLEPNREISPRVDIFDPNTETWARGPDFPGDAFGIAARGIGGSVYASAREGSLQRLDAGAEAWEPRGTLAFPRFFHQLVERSPEELIALGGIGGMHTHGRTRQVEVVRADGAAASRVSVYVLPNPSRAKNRQGLILHGDFLYAFGGNNSLEQHDFEPENFLSEAHRLHLPSMTWAEAEPFPEARQTMQTVSVDARAFIVGGFGHDGEVARTHPEVFELDLEAERFVPRPGSLPAGGRTQFGLTSHGGSLYIFGGLDYDPSREGEDAFRHLTTVLRAPVDDPSAGFVESGIELPGPRRAFGGAQLGDRYYMIAGMREGFTLVEDAVAYDFTTESFEPIAAPRHVRLSGEVVALGGKLYLAGGTVRRDGEMSSERSVEVYDPATNAWETLIEALPFETRHMRMLAYRDRLLIYSAHLEEPNVRIALIDPR